MVACRCHKATNNRSGVFASSPFPSSEPHSTMEKVLTRRRAGRGGNESRSRHARSWRNAFGGSSPPRPAPSLPPSHASTTRGSTNSERMRAVSHSAPRSRLSLRRPACRKSDDSLATRTTWWMRHENGKRATNCTPGSAAKRKRSPSRRSACRISRASTSRRRGSRKQHSHISDWSAKRPTLWCASKPTSKKASTCCRVISRA
jgi:hypothetical protein